VKDLTPKDHAEAIALYRAQIVGPLVQRALTHGDLHAALEELSQQRFRARHTHGVRTYSIATLERWYYAFKQGGLEALRPAARIDKGRGRALTPEQRGLLIAIREEHPTASVPLILDTLVADGRLEAGSIAQCTVRRFYAERGLDRVSLHNAGPRSKVRLRWQAERPGALWHADVCHTPAMVIDGQSRPVRIHGMLDDASRYVVAIEARHREEEADMLAVFVRALRRHGPPDVLYLDNGSTYRGEALHIACSRMGTALVHAKPYDAPARGKMERFWRTLRERCLHFSGSLSSLHDLNVRLYAWLDEHYHRAPHGGLMGKAPGDVFRAAQTADDSFDEQKLVDALTVREHRRVRRDNTVAVDGVDWETSLHFLAGRIITVARSLAEPDAAPWIEHEDKRFPLTRVDPVRNGHRKRTVPAHIPARPRASFDPTGALLDQSLGRTHEEHGS